MHIFTNTLSDELHWNIDNLFIFILNTHVSFPLEMAEFLLEL